jgi:CubicO group peptidase (beta-lactamase class C family)
MITRPAFAALLIVGIGFAFVTDRAPITAADAHARVDAIFSPFRASGSPGCAVGVTRAGHLLLTGAYGRADIERDVPIAADTVFEAGSVSKQFTAAAVILLAQRGRLSIDDDVREYLPEIPRLGSRITIGHLLSHTSGLRDWGAVLEAAGRPRGTRVYSPADVLAVVGRQRSLNFEPGAEHLYNNTGYSLLPLLVERVSGVSFVEFTRRHLFEPLGMRDTQWRDDFERVVDRRAIAYKADDDGFLVDMPRENVIGHAGLLTTIGDLLIWNEALDAGRLGRSLARELERPTRLTSGRSIAYARGLVNSQHRGVNEISHSGATSGYRSFVARYPDDRLAVAVLCNAAGINAPQLARQVADLFLPPPPQAKSAPAPVELEPAVMAGRTGLFRNRRTGEPLSLSVADGTLRSAAGETLVPLSESTFRFAGSTRRIEFASRPGSHTRLITEEGEAVPLDRAEPADLTEASLFEYEGQYVSDEAEAGYAVRVADGRLLLEQSGATSIELAPSYADGFTTSRGWIVRFVRGERGHVTSMSLGLPRVRDLRFVRTDDQGSDLP